MNNDQSKQLLNTQGLLPDEALESVSGGASATFSKMCPHCMKYSKFLILSRKKAVCKNCGETIEINK